MLTRRGFLQATAAGAATVPRAPRAGLAQTAPAAVKRGGTLTAAIFADPLTFDPHFTGNLQGRTATRAIHDTLLRVNAQGRLAPGLVEIVGAARRPDVRAQAAGQPEVPGRHAARRRGGQVQHRPHP